MIPNPLIRRTGKTIKNIIANQNPGVLPSSRPNNLKQSGTPLLLHFNFANESMQNVPAIPE
jgi:hypothetical protein